jgi:hypothetical protein
MTQIRSAEKVANGSTVAQPNELAKATEKRCLVMTAEQPRQVEQAIAKLKSFHDGDLAIVHVIACGEPAIPALRTMLFERERSGLYQARRRAVEALAALGAHHVLIEFLETKRTIADPTEQVGEDAVINAAALALANAREQHVFELLLRLAQRPALTGVIGTLGAFGRVKAIPVLLDALQEDASRLTAESALRKLGQSARPALLGVATPRVPHGERESESSARQRRSALRLLVEIGVPRNAWPSLRPLMHDTDVKTALPACEICFDWAPAAEWPMCTHCLIGLLAHEDWALREEIETCLVAHFDKAREVIERYLNKAPPDRVTSRQAEIVLRRVIARARSAPQVPR